MLFNAFMHTGLKNLQFALLKLQNDLAAKVTSLMRTSN